MIVKKQNTVNFGVIGAGAIARAFCDATKGEPRAILYAVGSRNIEKAKEYQKTYDFKQAYGDYTSLFSDPQVDCVYVATPHGLHYEQMLEILSYNKSILCEKAFTLNAAQASHVLSIAQEKHLFVMEAMWTRFLPVIQDTMKAIHQGTIGNVQRINVDFCFKADQPDTSRLYNPKLGGGALLDIGIYPVTLANLVLGKPNTIKADVIMHPTGVDGEHKITYHYDNAEAHLHASFYLNKKPDAYIYGTKGSVHIPNFFFTEKAFIYDQNDTLIKTIEHPHQPHGMTYEITETVDCILDGRIESKTMPHSETLQILSQLDDIRSLWGLTYPNEK